MIDQLLSSISNDAPPPDLSDELQALWWLKKGGLNTGSEWEKAHSICQTAEGTPSYDLVHALAHDIEGDASNAAYWYRRAGVAKTSFDLEEEWRSIVGHLSA